MPSARRSWAEFQQEANGDGFTQEQQREDDETDTADREADDPARPGDAAVAIDGTPINPYAIK